MQNTGALSGVVGGSGSFVTTPFYNDLGSCVYSSNGYIFIAPVIPHWLPLLEMLGKTIFRYIFLSHCIPSFTVPVEFGTAIQGQRFSFTPIW